MDKNRFNAEVHPHLTEFPIGNHGVGFDRLDLDAWVEEYKARNGRPGKALKEEGTWAKRSHQDCYGAASIGTSARSVVDSAFEKALVRATLKKPKNT